MRRLFYDLWTAINRFAAEAYKRPIWIIATAIFCGCIATFGLLPSLSKDANEYNAIVDNSASLLDEFIVSKKYTERVLAEQKEWSRLVDEQVGALDQARQAFSQKTDITPALKRLTQTYADSNELEQRLGSLKNEMRGLSFHSTESEFLQSGTDMEIKEVDEMLKFTTLSAQQYNALRSGRGDLLIQNVLDMTANLRDEKNIIETRTTALESYLRQEVAIYRRTESSGYDLDRRQTLATLQSCLIVAATLYILAYLVCSIVGIFRRWPVEPIDSLSIRL